MTQTRAKHTALRFSSAPVKLTSYLREGLSHKHVAPSLLRVVCVDSHTTHAQHSTPHHITPQRTSLIRMRSSSSSSCCFFSFLLALLLLSLLPGEAPEVRPSGLRAAKGGAKCTRLLGDVVVLLLLLLLGLLVDVMHAPRESENRDGNCCCCGCLRRALLLSKLLLLLLSPLAPWCCREEWMALAARWCSSLRAWSTWSILLL